MKMLEAIKARRKRIFMSLFGVLIGGVCVGFMKIAASVGVGTIVTAFFIGPLIEFSMRKSPGPSLGRQSNK